MGYPNLEGNSTHGVFLVNDGAIGQCSWARLPAWRSCCRSFFYCMVQSFGFNCFIVFSFAARLETTQNKLLEKLQDLSVVDLDLIVG